MQNDLRQQLRHAIDQHKRERLTRARYRDVSPHAIWKRAYRQRKRTDK